MSWGLPSQIENYQEAMTLWHRLKYEVEFPHFSPAAAHFRGEAQLYPSLMPKIARYGRPLSELTMIENKLIEGFKTQLQANGLWHFMEEGFISPYIYHSEWLLFQQAQHLTLATRFMDWTLKFQVALFFACERFPTDDGRVYILFPPSEVLQADRSEDEYAKSDPATYDQTIFINPAGLARDDRAVVKIAERFKQRQFGRFLVQPMEVAINDIKPLLLRQQVLHEFIIPAASKADILLEIAKEDARMTREWLFLEDDPRTKPFTDAITPIIENLHKSFLY